MLCGKLGVEFFSISQLLHQNFKVGLQLNSVRFNFHMITDTNVSHGIVHCSLYTRHIALKGDYHKKRIEMLAYTPVEFNYLETLATSIIIPARQNQLLQKNIFNNARIVGLLLQ